MSGVQVSNYNTKITYAQATKEVLTLYPGPIAALQKYGSFAPTQSIRSGAAYEFNILSSYGAATARPSSTGDLTNVGTANPDSNVVAMTTSLIWTRAQQDYERKVLWEISGNKGQFFDEASVKATGCIKGFLADMNLQMSKTGNGDWTTLSTASPATIAAGASADITVDDLEFVRPDMVWQVYTTNNTSLVSDVILRVNRKQRGVGQGTLNVTNIGGSTYTLAAGDTFTMLNGRSTSSMYFSGLLDAINDDPYPRNEGNNVRPANSNDYLAAVLAGSGTVNLDKIWQLLVLVQAQKPNSDVQGLKDPVSGYMDSSQVVFCHPYHVTAIRQQLATQQKFISGLPDTNSVWGPITMIDGRPFYSQFTNPSTSVMLVDAAGWQFEIPGALLRSTQNGAPWIAIPGTSNDEMTTCTAVISVCTDRKSQGILTGVRGIDPLTGAAA